MTPWKGLLTVKVKTFDPEKKLYISYFLKWKRKGKIGKREGKNGQKGRERGQKGRGKATKNPKKSVDSLKNNSRGTLKLTFSEHQNAPL